jgi:hypothetical protein
MADMPTATVVPTIAISRATRRAVLPAPGDTITAPRDLPSDELGFLTEGIFAVGAPYRDEEAISLSLSLFADLRAFSVALDSLPTPTPLEPPGLATFSVY